MTTPDLEPGDLSQLLEDLARVPRLPVPEQHFASLPSGTRVGRFVIQREIGRGGFGVVYAAADPDLGRQVALKLLRHGIAITRGETEWIRREAEAVARLNHPAIVTLHDSGSCEHGAFMVFELLQGEPLDVKIARGPLEPREALQIASAVAGALEHAHAAGVLHRDLKPANVFLCSSGVVKVLDFGVAQLFDRDARPTSGTPKYMAPEQRDGLAEDGRTDLYSLGVVLLAMLRGGNTEVPSKAPPRAAGELERLAYDLTRHDPGKRPASARVVLDRLDGIRQRRVARRRWALAALAAVLALGTWGAWEWTRPREAPPGERWMVSIAPTVNRTNSVELDHLDELIRAGLIDSPRFRILDRARVEAALGVRVGTDEKPSLDAWRRAADGLGARLVVVPEASGDKSAYRIKLSGLDAGTGREEIRAEALATSLDAIPQTVDEALLSLREKSRERLEDRKRTFRPLASLTTPSLTAFHHYQVGEACLSNPFEISNSDDIGRCGAHFRQALEADPSFPLVHHRMARIVAAGNTASPEVARHIGEALAAPERLSRRDDALIRAWKDHVDGDDDAAFRRYATLVADDPGDVEATYLAGDLLFHVSRYAEAVPYLAKVADLVERHAVAFDHLVESYGLSGKDVELARLLDSIDRPAPARVRAVAQGEQWLGRHDRAIAIARDPRWSAPGKARQYLLVRVLSAAGQVEEAAEVSRAMLEQDPNDGYAYQYRIMLALKQGRAREAWGMLGAPPAEFRRFGSPEWNSLKASVAAAERNLPLLRSTIRKFHEVGPENVPYFAVQLALLGTEADVKAMRAMVSSASIAGREIDALGKWKRGDPEGAIHGLTMLEREAPRPDDALSPDYLLAEVALGVDPAEALLAAGRYRKRIPKGIAAGWTVGRSLLVSAEAAWRLGRRDEAMEFIAQAEKLLAHADRGFPTAVETARLRKAIESGAPPQNGVHFGPR